MKGAIKPLALPITLWVMGKGGGVGGAALGSTIHLTKLLNDLASKIALLITVYPTWDTEMNEPLSHENTGSG